MARSLVVGAGISGAVLANLIANNLNENVLVIDKRNHIAGNIYDYKDQKTHITVHKYGPHIFHTNNKKVFDFLSEYTKWHYFFLKPKAIMEGNFASIPFNLTTLYDVFSDPMAQKIEENLINTFGYGKKVPILRLREYKEFEFIADYIYEHMFKNYTIKQWGLLPEDIDSSVTERVPVYISHDNRYFQDKYQGIPLDGYSQMIKNMLSHKNIEVRLGVEYKNLNENFDRIFYCGSIDEFFDYKFGYLEYRSLNFDIRTINKEYYQPSAIVNYPNNYDFTRITEHKYFLDEKSEKTIISVEYPAAFEPDKNERFYPISNQKNNALYEKYLNEAKKAKNLYFIGRLGAYKYYNMDLAVEKIFEFFEKELK